MATFRYTSLAQNTSGSAGVIDAPDRPAAVRILLSKGITPASVEPMGGATNGAATNGKAHANSNGASNGSNALPTVALSAPAPAGGVTFDIATADNTATDQGTKRFIHLKITSP